MTRVNPFTGKTASVQQPEFVHTATQTPLTTLRKKHIGVGDSEEPLVSQFSAGHAGHINASSKHEMIQLINSLTRSHSAGIVAQKRATITANDTLRRMELLESAYNGTAANFQILGDEVTNEIWKTVRRDTFIGKVFQERELVRGEEPKIRQRQNDVRAFIMTSDSYTPESRYKQRVIVLPEYDVNANITIENKEILKANTDLLAEKQEDGREQCAVKLDTVMKRLLDISAADSGTPSFFSDLSPTIFTNLKHKVQQRGKKVGSALLAQDLWDDIITHATFNTWFDPVSKHELILTGMLGSLLDVVLMSDSFLSTNLRVLEPGDLYMLADPKQLGQHLIRQRLIAKPTDQAVNGRNAKGWFISGTFATGVADSGGVAKGKKVV